MSPQLNAGHQAFEGLITVHSEAPARDGCTWAWTWCTTPGLPSLCLIYIFPKFYFRFLLQIVLHIRT